MGENLGGVEGQRKYAKNMLYEILNERENISYLSF